MADVDVGDVLRLGCVWLLGGAYEIANVFHARVIANGGGAWADVADDMAEYAADIYAEILPIMTNAMDTFQLNLQNLTQVTTIGAYSWAAPLTGGSAADYLATGLAVLTWGRTYKPRVQIRKYWGVFTEAAMTDGVWLAATVNDCVDAMAVHLNSFTGTNGLEVVGVAYNRTLETTTDAVSGASTAEPAYQRRRKRGRGS
ncbi:MAG: hypothetical protein KAV00_18470 [Phycisphaerae bacterium]|nr:hypothetical protein [Phycisphaerae bacterium]